jgi:outer membrane protein OmpA-like peptidoglycan-associated protein
MNGVRVFALTEGNYVEVAPRVTPATYLHDPFTIEFDFFPKAGSYGKVGVFLSKGDDDKNVFFGLDTGSENLQHDLSGTFPGGEEKYFDVWHHAGLAFTHNQVKAYIDQYRVLTVPDFDGFMPEAVRFGGIAESDSPILLRNVRIATGGGATLIDELTKNGKIITHGILFDVNAATVKPASMGTISAVAKALANDKTLKLEIGGHTDSDGDAARNMTLSQQRADAVKKLLVDQGVDAARLIAKGYGASKPIEKNDSAEGKANNRRVEFTKM